MKYEKHDFASNFINANAARDVGLTKGLVLGEISRLIVAHPVEIQDAIKDAGIELKKEPSELEIVVALSKNLSHNRALAKSISKLLIKYGSKSDKAAHLKAEGDEDETDWGALAQKGVNLTKSIMNIFGRKKRKKAEEARRKKEEAKARKAAQQAQKQELLAQQQLLARLAMQRGAGVKAKAKKGKGLSTGAIVGIIGAVVVIGGTIAFFLIKRMGKPTPKSGGAPTPAPIPVPA